MLGRDECGADWGVWSNEGLIESDFRVGWRASFVSELKVPYLVANEIVSNPIGPLTGASAAQSGR